MVARLFVELEFRAIAQGLYELLWLKIILDDLRIKWDGPMKLYCDNKSAIDIAHNPMQHDRTKHIEKYCDLGVWLMWVCLSLIE